MIPAPFPASDKLFFLTERKLLKGNRTIEEPLGYFSQNSEFIRNSLSISRKKITNNPWLPDMQALRQTRKDMEKNIQSKKGIWLG